MNRKKISEHNFKIGDMIVPFNLEDLKYDPNFECSVYKIIDIDDYQIIGKTEWGYTQSFRPENISLESDFDAKYNLLEKEFSKVEKDIEGEIQKIVTSWEELLKKVHDMGFELSSFHGASDLKYLLQDSGWSNSSLAC